MMFLLNHPILLFLISFIVLWSAANLGVQFRKRRGVEQIIIDDEDFGLVVGATLTLLGLIIGFTFSMAVSRYDQRKNFEEAEANAIGTEYVRADLLPAADAAKVRSLLREYTDQRIYYYMGRREEFLAQVTARTTQLQSQLWSAVTPGGLPRDPISALVVSGMNDALNSQGYSEAAWRNRVPYAAWCLLLAIAFFCNFLLGIRSHVRGPVMLLILPIALSVSFFLIADIDSPRSGVIRVHPQNLESLADSLRGQ
jgi:hypothetical protein